jgi:pilus assembly protein Flp/PilA
MALHLQVPGCPGPKLGNSTQEKTQMNTMLLKMYVKFQDLMNREEGQDLVEYALVLALITVGAVAILTGIGTKVVNTLTSINTAL